MMWIFVVSHVCLACWPTCVAKAFSIGHYANFSTNFVQMCHACRQHWSLYQYMFIPLSVTDFGRGSEIEHEQNLLTSFSHIHFNWSRWNFIKCQSNSSSSYWFCFWVIIIESREISAVLLTVWKICNIVMHLDVYELIWFKLDMVIDSSQLYILILVKVIKCHSFARKQRVLCLLSEKSF